MTHVALTGGGIVGHASPLIAMAQTLVELDPDIEITCTGMSKGLETRVIPQVGLKLKLIWPVPMPRRSNLNLAKLSWNLRQPTHQVRTILSRAKVQALIGFSSHVVILAYLTACAMKIPALVREANLMAGIANKVAARLVAFTGYAFPDTQIQGGRWTGMPMNHSTTQLGIIRAEARERFRLDPERPALLVSGGSQGARTTNQTLSATIPAILNAGIQVLHVLDVRNFTDANVVIESGSGTCYTPVAYVGAMVEAYVVTDLVIGWTGAGTVMETAVLGLPMIFIPLLRGNGKQARNTAGLVADGAGTLPPEVEFSTDKLSNLVIPTITDAKRLARMAGLARPHSPTDVADVLARATVNVVQREEAS